MDEISWKLLGKYYIAVKILQMCKSRGIADIIIISVTFLDVTPYLWRDVFKKIISAPWTWYLIKSRNQLVLLKKIVRAQPTLTETNATRIWGISRQIHSWCYYKTISGTPDNYLNCRLSVKIGKQQSSVDETKNIN